MSAIAGIFNASGRPIEPGHVARMLEPMRRRGPDGASTWHSTTAAMGHCLLRSIPVESDATQPLASAAGDVVLVLDGQVHNRTQLTSALRSAGARLRDTSDAELVLHAYEAWGQACCDRIIGEFAFFIWDGRQQLMFGARDAAGARHFYYHRTPQRLAFASEIRGLLALPDVERRVNSSRMLDFLVDDFDRDDEIGTLYEGIDRLPAGHAMQVDRSGMKTWRYWDPKDLTAAHFTSLEECTREFMAVVDVAVASRLRHTGAVGAMLSGGMDSSTIVGLISGRHRSELCEPLRTYSLALEDRTVCGDWQAVSQILRHDPWLRATAVGSQQGEAFAHKLDAALTDADEPFGVLSAMPYQLLFERAAADGCKLIFDGMAGDTLFYSPEKTLAMAVRQTRLDLAPALVRAFHRHEMFGWGAKQAGRSIAARLTPAPLRAAWRAREREQRLRSGMLGLLRPGVADALVGAREKAKRQPGPSDIEQHAALFTSGLLSFAQERNGAMAGQFGLETLSPLADRRVIEFAVRMPLAAKLALPWYKHVMRNGTAGLLPDEVRWRRSLEGHPGWNFYEHMQRGLRAQWPSGSPPAGFFEPVGAWVDLAAVARLWPATNNGLLSHSDDRVLSLAIAAKWLRLNGFSGP
ncbi:hypothetical protein GHT07_05990 [Caenimonas koreensis DSM 17982]|uniref:asparagine synthase (glutamine-hydrolyzing) n=1 Tax=Caenimonas koreensis DSM 17982 TaxID=1121255 RepID=A0A844B5P2_9BURK|nr:asparagine synthase-related protein [Caenimonas koreensis]MRD46817.1 hypothetical protein [Caenimonas koreensis DSM 17982]